MENHPDMNFNIRQITVNQKKIEILLGIRLKEIRSIQYY